MLEEKEVWNVVDGLRAKPTTVVQTRKKEKDNAIASKIIKQGVSADLYINIIGEKNFQRSWETFRRVCSQVGQGVVYSILKELLNYPRVAKPLGYEKKATTIFAKVKQLVQRLQSAVTEQRSIWESITLVVAVNLLHNDFEMTTAPLLYSGNKDLEEIQQIVPSTEAANLAKRAVGAITNLALMAKKTQLERYPAKPKTNKECANCGKKGHYAGDCHMSNKKKPEESLKEGKRARSKKNQAKAAAARLTTNHNDSDTKPYPAGRAFMTRTDEGQSGKWYLDSCASRHICNSQEKFADLCPKTYEFVTTGGDIIRSEQVGTVILPFENCLQLTFCNVA